MTRPADFSDLPFRIFAWVSDHDGALGIREVEGFTALMEDLSWTSDPHVTSLLSACDVRYSELWRAYGAGGLESDASTVVRRALEWLGGLEPDQRAAATDGLDEFVRRLVANRAPWWRRAFSSGSQSAPTLSNLRAKLSPLALPIAPAAADGVAAHDSAASLTPAVLDARTFWHQGGVELRCAEIVDETPDVKTFRFASVEPALFSYKPGQAATLEVPIGAETIRRSYTISSSPSRPWTLEFTVKRLPGGQVSSWLHRELRVGRTLTVHGPHGRFNFHDIPSLRPIFLSAGSGITPMLAMVRWLVDTSSAASIDFVHFASTERDLIARTELEHLAGRRDNLRLFFVCTRAEGATTWTGERGRICEDVLERLVPDCADRDVYLCGPQPFMKTARSVLQNLGCDPHRVHQESFGLRSHQAETAGAQSPVGDPSGDDPRYVLRLRRSDKELSVSGTMTVLDALEASGVRVPYSCRAGVCGTCKVKRLSGEVAASASDVLTAADAAAGYILTCSSHLCGDLELEL